MLLRIKSLPRSEQEKLKELKDYLEIQDHINTAPGKLGERLRHERLMQYLEEGLRADFSKLTTKQRRQLLDIMPPIERQIARRLMSLKNKED
jgi:hypothetical protein